MSLQTILRLHPALRDDIADLSTRRPLPGPALAQLDPFLFLNHHGPQRYGPHNRGLPFGPHPHRGFETVTFILQGELMHSDSAGHDSVIEGGGVQWMTAGSGLVHAELSPERFKRDGGELEILQLWLNLPSRLKMTAPRYIGLQSDAIARVPTADGRAVLHLVAGRHGGQSGPVAPLTDVFLSWIALEDGAQLSFDGLARRNVLLYVVSGAIDLAGKRVPAFTLAELDGQGDGLAFQARGPAVVLFGHAPPIGEPVVAHGPFVMNTRAEIEQAVRDYHSGLFG
ncbi:MAG: pirin family protein [Pseudomonadota bacterium]